MRSRWIALLILPLTAAGADDGRVSFLEQEVRNLQRQVLALSRQVDELRTRPDRPAPANAARPGAESASDPDQWIDAKKWRQLRPGMPELEVISLLGPPTSMRETDGARTLFYALEIGTSGFLGGSVRLQDRIVSEVRPPMLQ